MYTPAFSPQYDQALQFAARAHRQQVRKGTDIPYIAHAVHVSVVLLRHGFDEDVVIAGLLHDVVEDCGVAPHELEALFGAEVARLVAAVSERKWIGGSERSWEERKAEAIARLRNSDPKIAALKAADALHNIHSIVADLALVGAAVWQRFKRGPDQILWYYREILAAVHGALGDHPIIAELARALTDLEHAVHEYN
ncbi:MAG: HD domain-containing protein [Roseiflexus sp.]|nr:HD domain-containing protein [Roseiflexus sp.]MCS7288406.1 HD domain-containing protein [Roseiflexus sp.]MDW8146555.1 HD domain-containing protein [Roseiflexaceae bacterium]MDW8231165.1 HD domain-containing protein [Roseiflexaceae bacterium]